MSGMTESQIQASALGYYFARFVARQEKTGIDGIVPRTAAWLADIQVRGDVCLDLQHYAGSRWPDREDCIPSLQGWRDALLASNCVGEPGDASLMTLDGARLYLTRFWNDERRIVDAIGARLVMRPEIDPGQLRSGLKRLFGSSPSGGIDWQMLAAAMAVTNTFSVISGGPGTGKTTSLVKVLVLLLEQYPQMRIRLAAPTGKAAARMMESIRSAKSTIDTDEAIRERIPEQASTIHRLLGYGARGFRHDSSNPLALDCLVIDEASMVDLPMMARLLEALPERARLILLGDRDQLASVEAGNVLGDITGHGHEIAYTREQVATLAGLTGIEAGILPSSESAPTVANVIALLRTSYRFGSDSGIGRLARAINGGRAEEVEAILAGDSGEELAWLTGVTHSELLNGIVDGYLPYLQAESPDAALQQFEKVRVLCALRKGAVGVEAINRAVATGLVQRGALDAGEVVHGMPVMITVNSYELGLFNGDTGLLWRDESGRLRAWFRQADGSLRDIPFQSLPQYEPAWAITVHKSQGSEFDRVTLLLSGESHDQVVLTRELLYTAVTRARKRFVLYGQSDTVAKAVGSTVERSTGLASRLGWFEL